ncbi:MAG: cytochrome P450 [Microthrixaceae bacterium]
MARRELPVPAVVAHSAGVAGRFVPWAPLKLLSLATPWWPLVDPAPVYEWFARRGPVVPLLSGKWLITRHEVGRSLLLDLGMSSNVQRQADGSEVGSPYDRLVRSSLAYLDPPEHARHRRPASTHFGRQSVQHWAEVAGTWVAERLVSLGPDGRGDLVAEVAEPVADLVMCGLCGLPPGRPDIIDRLQVMSRRFENSPVSSRRIRRQADDATVAMFADPVLRDDIPEGSLLATLTRAAAEDPELGEHYAATNTLFIFGAGRNALITLITSSLLLGAAHPDAWEEAGTSTGAAERFVDEVLRWDPPARFGFRVAPKQLTIEGTTIPAGSDVAVLFGAANRDPAVLEDPNDFRPDRHPNPHLSYGGGIHHCIGGPLATAMVAAVVGELARTLGPLALERPRYLSGTPTRRPIHLPATWSTTGRRSP